MRLIEGFAGAEVLLYLQKSPRPTLASDFRPDTKTRGVGTSSRGQVTRSLPTHPVELFVNYQKDDVLGADGIREAAECLKIRQSSHRGADLHVVLVW